ncbi:MAG TPA: hypothetical protein DCG75_07470 [Bacteroidales bacterium]|nr:hypothetical protein [Bacteroidales bacterium]
MSKHNPKAKLKSKKNENEHVKSDFFDKLDKFFDSKGNVFFWVSLFFTLLFSFLLFNFRVSEAGDDSAYIFRAFKFVKEFQYPSFQGPLYPIFLSVFIWIFGLNITMLKSLSLVAIIFHLYFFYRAFKGRVSGFLLIYVMLIVSFNSFVLYHASQTYSEAFFLFLQALFFFYFFNAFVSKSESTSLKENWGSYLILGMFLLFLGLTRSVGYGGFIAVILFFILTMRWKSAAFTTGAFVLEFGLFTIIKKFLFQSTASQFSGQLNRLMQVDPFDAAKGNETFSGFIDRFFGNSNLYLSKHLYKFIGFRPEILDPKTILTVIAYILFAVAIYFAFRKNKYLLFTGIYLTVLIGITFIIVQTRWDQDRLILVYFPFVLLFLFSGIYYLGKIKSLKFIQVILPVLLIIIFFTNLNVTKKKVKANDEYLMESLAGNKFYGMTPDWINYIRMSQWAAKNTPDSVMIACRKPSISFVYAKREFYGIYRITTEDPDELLQNLKNNKVKYIIMGSLRKYPNQKTQYTINTVQRYLYFIQQKYPEKIKHIQTIGVDEPAYLFEIIY